MSPGARRVVGLSALAGLTSLALLVAPALAPAGDIEARRALAALTAAGGPGAAAEAQDTSGKLSNDEVVVATLGPSGLPDEVVLVSRLVSVGGPERTVADPASVTNVKYLDRLGRPETQGTDVLLPAGGSGQHTVLTQARFDKPLPVAMHAQYEVDGQVVAPDQVVGSAGEVRTTYTLTNTTAEEQELRYEDAAGSAHSRSEPVFAPFAGSAVITVPADTQVISAPGAVRYADAAGNTVLAWNVSLYPPLTSYQQELVLRTRATRAAIPAVAVSLTPVTAKKDPAVQFSANLLDGAVTGNTELYSGLRALDDQAVTLADGAGALAGGMDQLAGGADTASTATGSLAGGMDELSSGAQQLATGNRQLAAALAKAAAGAQELASGTAKLAGADTAAAGTALGQLTAAVAGLEQGARTLAQRFGSSADPPLPSPLPSPDSDQECTAPLGTASPATASAQPSSATIPPSGAGGSDAGEGAAGTSASPAPSPSGAATGSFDDDCITLYQAVRALVTGLGELTPLVAAITAEATAANTAAQSLAGSLGSIGTDAGTAAAGAAALSAQLCGATPQLPPPACATLLGVAQSAGRAAQTTAGLTPTVTSLLTATGKLAAYAPVLAQAISGAQQAGTKLLAGMDALGAGLTGTSQTPGLVTGLQQLGAGLEQFAAGLQSSSQQLSQALDALAGGTQQLADGVDQAAGGAAELAAGASAVAGGVEQAADGAGQLASGIATLASGAADIAAGGAQLATGAGAFQEQGTAKAAQSVLDASTDPALAQAWLSAAGQRAADALPYGPPAGATGHVAYLLDIPGQPAPAPSLWERFKLWWSS